MLAIRKAFYAVLYFFILLFASIILLAIFERALNVLTGPGAARIDFNRSLGPGLPLLVFGSSLIVSIAGSVRGWFPGTRKPQPKGAKAEATVAATLKRNAAHDFEDTRPMFATFDGCYCPNCSARFDAPPASCWNCKASFGADSAWKPTARPNGEFREFKQPQPTPVPAAPSTVRPEKAAPAKKEGFFKSMTKPIASRQEALDTVKDGAKSFYFLAALNAAIGFFAAPALIIDAVYMAVVSFLVARFHSRVAAGFLLAWAIVVVVTTVMNKLSHSGSGGSNLILALIALAVAIRMFVAAWKLNGRFAQAQPAEGSGQLPASEW